MDCLARSAAAMLLKDQLAETSSKRKWALYQELLHKPLVALATIGTDAADLSDTSSSDAGSYCCSLLQLAVVANGYWATLVKSDLRGAHKLSVGRPMTRTWLMFLRLLPPLIVDMLRIEKLKKKNEKVIFQILFA